MNTKINNNLNITEGSFGYPSLQYSSPSVVSEKDEYNMLLKKNEVKNLVRNEGFRISPESYEGINRAVESTIKKMLEQVANDGMKTLMIQHTGARTTVAKSGSCSRCANIKDTYLRWSRNIQQFCADEATIMYNRLRGK